MRDLIHRFASLRVTVVLVVLVLLALAAGTIVESLHGAPAAGRTVYQAPWFRALLAVFALNLTASLVDLWPWGRRRIGYALTHGSMLVILAGGLLTEFRKVEGQLQIWEGEESTAVVGGVEPGSSAEPRTVATLPFAVKLDSFEVDYYEGTRRPAQFRSRVIVKDGGAETPAVIEMNRALAHGGYKFFQSSYRETPQRDLTILSVSKDPGESIVFLGYYGLVLGMLVVLGTRVTDRRRAARPGPRRPRPLRSSRSPPRPPRRRPCRRPPRSSRCAALPVQHDGRVMPLDTLARETVWNVTGKRSIWGQDPLATFLGWAFDPTGWAVQPVVPVKDARAGRGDRPARRHDVDLVPGARVEPGADGRDRARARRRSSRSARSPAREGRLEARGPAALDAADLRGRRAARRAGGEAGRRVEPRREHAHSAADLRAAAATPGSRRRALPAARLDREITYNRARPTAHGVGRAHAGAPAVDRGVEPAGPRARHAPRSWRSSPASR